MYIQKNALSIDEIIDQLYDFSKPGGFGVARALTDKGCNELHAAMEKGRHLMTVVERNKGLVTQEMETVYIEKIGDIINEVPALAMAIKQLKSEYDEIHDKIATKGGFSETANSMGLHRYAKGSLGITPHQDYKQDINIIVSLVIDGYAPFFVANDRQKNGELQLPSEPGSIIFMRAARKNEEQSKRPFHYLVGPMNKDRYSILIRTRKSD